MPFGLTDKTNRVVKFLLGLRNRRVKTALKAYGMHPADIREGWALLAALGTDQADMPNVEEDDSATLRDLDAWENRWFPTADAGLGRRFPASHARLFLNLSQSEGPAVAVGVRVFVDRLGEMAKADGVFGVEGPKARELLASRGLTDARIAEARELLTALAEEVTVPDDVRTPEDDEERSAAAEKALWDWYIEWSKIARIAIKQRELLRKLGFLADHSTASDETETAAPTNSATTATAPGAVL